MTYPRPIVGCPYHHCGQRFPHFVSNNTELIALGDLPTAQHWCTFCPDNPINKELRDAAPSD